MAILLDTVPPIIGGCSKEQVMRIHTSRSIAFVEDFKSRWYRPNVKFPRNPVGTLIFVLKVKLAILASKISSHPQPASSHRLHTDFFFKLYCRSFSGKMMLRHVNPPYRVDVLRAWRKLILPLRPYYYSTNGAI
jgi:hypothetical protein